MQRNKTCEICKKPAQFYCGSCSNAYYCSQQHQKTHWKTHKNNCSSNHNKTKKNDKYRQQDLLSKRKNLRKKYFESYSHQFFEECLIIARLLQQAQQQNLLKSKDIFDSYEYASTICLVIKTLLMLGQTNQAQLKIQNYLKVTKLIEPIEQFIPPVKGNIKQFQLFMKKLSLISVLANLCYALGMPCINLYMKYTDYIQSAFGPQSLQASNCYFLIGCYYAEQGYLNKAVACFERAAFIRGEDSGQCFFNMGILFKWLGKSNKSIQMFERALQKRIDQYSQYTIQVAEVYENIGIVYMQQFDFKTAMIKFEKAFDIRSSDTNHPDYKRLADLIVYLYKKLDAYIKSNTIDMEKPEIYLHLKEVIRDNKKFGHQLLQRIAESEDQFIKTEYQQWEEEFIKKRDKFKFKMEPEQFKIIDKFNPRAGIETDDKQNVEEKEFDQQDQKIRKTQNQFKLVISQQYLSRLTSHELVSLAELQLELEQCLNQYRAATTALDSKFLKGLDESKKNELIQTNPQIFNEPHLIQKQAQRKAKKPITPRLNISKTRN